MKFLKKNTKITRRFERSLSLKLEIYIYNKNDDCLSFQLANVQTAHDIDLANRNIYEFDKEKKNLPIPDVVQ